MVKNITTLRVRYAETDKMQFVYNGKYLEYFEVGRAELLRSLGLPYSTIEESGYQLPLTEAGLKYIRPAYYDDLLSIEATIEKIVSPRLRINYRIFRNDSPEVLVEGFTEHVFISTETKKAVRPPKFFVDHFSNK